MTRLTPSDRLHRMRFNEEFRIRRFAEAQAARSVPALPRRSSFNWELALSFLVNVAAWSAVVAVLARWW